MPLNQIQSTLLNAVTVTGPSSAIDTLTQPISGANLIVNGVNCQVQLESSPTGVEGSYLPCASLPGYSNPVSISAASTVQIACSTPYRFVRANVLQLQNGAVTAVLQGFPFNIPAPQGPSQLQAGLTGNFIPDPTKPGAQLGLIPIPPGSMVTPRVNFLGAQYVQQIGGRFAAAVRAGQVFFAAHQAVQALSVNNVTATGIIITNPQDSPVVVELLEIQVAIASLPAGQCSLVLTGGSFTKTTPVSHTTAMKVQNALLGSNAVGYAKVDSAATIPDNQIIRVVGAGTAATVATSTAFPPLIEDEVEGLVCLMPGACISLQATVTAVSVWASIAWREVPIIAS